MSKLAERIRRAARTQAPSLGFSASTGRGKPTPTMLLLVRFAADQLNKAAEALGRGGDAIIVETADPGRLKGELQEMGESPVGVRMAAVDGGAVAKLREAGVDFAVFEADLSGAEALLDEQLGFVLAVGQDISDVALRVIESLALDGLVVPPLDGPLTLRCQLELKRFFLLSRTPLLVEVQPDISAAQLRVLRDAGVIGVIVDGTVAGGRLGDLRQAIDGLPPRRARGREERLEALLPAATPTAAEEEEGEEYP